MAENTRANLTKSSTWTRLIFIVLFSITFNPHFPDELVNQCHEMKILL